MSATNETAIELKGLREDNPRNFLAALGLLRLVDLLWPAKHATLAWTADGHPVLSTTEVLQPSWPADAVGALQEFFEKEADAILHGSVIKTNYAAYRDACIGALRFSAGQSSKLARLPALLYAAYSSQVRDHKSDDVQPTLFSFGNGQGGKNLLKDIRELVGSLTTESFHRSLIGIAKPIGAKSLRWNPAEHRAAAYRAHDPGTKLKGDETLDYPTFNVLAFIGLTFYPSVPDSKNGRTTGFVYSHRRWDFVWPLWGAPLYSDELSSLLHTSIDQMSAARGIHEIWRSERFSADKSLYFAPAERVR